MDPNDLIVAFVTWEPRPQDRQQACATIRASRTRLPAPHVYGGPPPRYDEPTESITWLIPARSWRRKVRQVRVTKGNLKPLSTCCVQLSVVARLIRVRVWAKFGVGVLALMLAAMPVMACTIPGAAMTAVERDCCKRMAQECGKTGMKQSHSCCQTTSVPDHLSALKSSSDVSAKHFAPVVLHLLPSMPAVAVVPESGLSLSAPDIHSPPVSPPASISVLRI